MEPGSGLLSLYTSTLGAGLLTSRLRAAGTSLEATRIPCLGCYLRGAASELGRERIRGAFVDGQWQVRFHVCEAHGTDIPQHFTLNDDQHTYHLLGCAHTTGAIWAPMVWESLAFNMNCRLEDW